MGLNNYIASFIPKDLHRDSETLRKARLLVINFVATGLFLLAFAVLYVVIDYPLGIWTCLYGFAVDIILLVVIRTTGSFRLSGRIFDLNALVLFILLIYGTGGIRSSIISWLAIIPASGFVFGGWRRGLWMLVLALVVVFTYLVVELAEGPLPYLYDVSKTRILNAAVFSGLLGYFFMVLLIYEVAKERRIEELDLLNEEVRTMNAKLETLVGERTENLSRAKAELDTFLYESSHALRRPLARIMGLIRIIREEESEAVAAKMQGLIDTTSSRMDEMLRKLVMVSEINSGKVEAAEVSLPRLIEDVRERHKEAFSGDALSFEMDAGADLSVVTDGALLSAALEQLLENALLYFSEDPARKHHVRVRAFRENGSVHLHVWDNGIGIPEGQLENVGEMFFRATERSTGSGLGLYVARKAMERMDGVLEVESVEGEWTEARLCVRDGHAAGC